MNDCPCLRIDDVNISLKKTFEFIQQYQVYSTGEILKTIISVNINLLESQSSSNANTRVSASNLVIGIISAVTDTNVVVIAESDKEGKYSEYTINYSSIIQIGSTSIAINYSQYVRYMDTLPPLCLTEANQYTEMVGLMETTMEKYRSSEKQPLQIIFNGVKGRIIYAYEVKLVKNLLTIDDLTIIPLSYIGGFAIIPSCEEKGVKEDGIDVW